MAILPAIVAGANLLSSVLQHTKKKKEAVGPPEADGTPPGAAPMDKAAVASQALGLAQGIGSAVASRKARRAEPPRTDLSQVRAAQELSRKRKAFEVGAMSTPYTRPIRQAQAQATAGALRAGAGLRGISAAQKTAQQGMLDAMGMQQQTALGLQEQEIGMVNAIAQRRLDLQRVGQTKQEATAALLGNAAISNSLGAALQRRDKDGTESPLPQY